mmetsp:Transcript_20707/g.61818  ORF Transcript_20707/g.61818 Transcript_20707/m.61818 type:complete len:402 (-) Transcript_20707:266-1471(-)
MKHLLLSCMPWARGGNVERERSQYEGGEISAAKLRPVNADTPRSAGLPSLYPAKFDMVEGAPRDGPRHEFAVSPCESLAFSLPTCLPSAVLSRAPSVPVRTRSGVSHGSIAAHPPAAAGAYRKLAAFAAVASAASRASSSTGASSTPHAFSLLSNGSMGSADYGEDALLIVGTAGGAEAEYLDMQLDEIPPSLRASALQQFGGRTQLGAAVQAQSEHRQHDRHHHHHHHRQHHHRHHNEHQHQQQHHHHQQHWLERRVLGRYQSIRSRVSRRAYTASGPANAEIMVTAEHAGDVETARGSASQPEADAEFRHTAAATATGSFIHAGRRDGEDPWSGVMEVRVPSFTDSGAADQPSWQLDRRTRWRGETAATPVHMHPMVVQQMEAVLSMLMPKHAHADCSA